MYRYFIVLIFLFCSCFPVGESILTEEYGDYYFSMDCSWVPPATLDGIWWCDQDVETELIEGYIFISLRTLTELAICGKNLLLNTGYSLHDNLIPALTQNNYHCYISTEVELGNEFDWVWNENLRRLQLIWRAEEIETKILTLIIEEGEADHLVSGEVYYKTIAE